MRSVRNMYRRMFLPLLLVFLIPAGICPLEGSGLSSRGIETPNNHRDRFIADNGDLVITEIRIEGLRKTREAFVRSFITAGPGDALSRFDGDMVEQGLRSRGIFSKINIDYTLSDKGVIIVITLREKHTLIPVPFMRYADSELSMGLFIVETNFLGMNKMIYGGGYYTPAGNGWLLSGGYSDPGLGGGRFRWYLRATGGRERFENGDPSERIYRRYRAGYMTTAGGAGYGFTPRSTVYATAQYGFVMIDMNYRRNLAAPDGGSYLRPGVRYVYRDIIYGEYLTYGLQLSMDYGPTIHLTGKGMLHQYSAMRCTYQAPAISDHRAGILFYGGMGNSPEIYQDRIGGTVARTLPARKVVAPRYLSSDVEYEIPFRFIKVATPSFVLFWETGVYDSPGSGVEFFYGPGAGIRVYLKKIALPALGLNTAYNGRTGGVYVSAALGFQL